MLVAAFVLQLALIVRGFIHYDIIGGQRFQVTIGEYVVPALELSSQQNIYISPTVTKSV